MSRVDFDRPPDRAEVISRFIFSSGHFSATNQRVKPQAFLPASEPVETSVFRGTGLSDAEVQSAGDAAGAAGNRALRAWGNVEAGVVFDAGLLVNPDNIPPRHAAIVGWPSQKDAQIVCAQELAAAATLRLRF